MKNTKLFKSDISENNRNRCEHDTIDILQQDNNDD